MSYLDNVRLVFAGRFQADISTVNNDVRHFDNATFLPEYQEFQTQDAANGWFNPTGSGAFRLIDCRIVRVGYADGSETDDPAAESVLGMFVGGGGSSSSGKLVDIDPQWQLASAIWGMQVRLTESGGRALVSGTYRPHAFRDLWFGRMLPPASGDDAASAIFQSVVDGLQWPEDLHGSRALTELKEAAAATNTLSIRLATFGYHAENTNAKNQAIPDFTVGTVIGVIGPQLPDEPESYVVGRRFAPANGTVSWNGCNYATARIDGAARRLFVDLGNAIQLVPTNNDPAAGPLVPPGTLNDIGRLWVGVLTNPETPEFSPATKDSFVPIAEIHYKDGWLLKSSGVFSTPLTDDQMRVAQDRPLALAALTELNAGSGLNGEFGQIAIRETPDGLFVDAEPLVFRIDPPGSGEATIRAARYGAPIAGASIAVAQLGRMPGQGGGAASGPGVPGGTPIPDIGVPTTVMTLPAATETGADGSTPLRFSATDPGNVRKYIDGQLYLIDFRLPGQGNQARSQFDYIVVHVRQAWPVPAQPSWADVSPILTQYANLYPIMSRQLIDLSNEADVARHAKLLHFAFSRPMDDPNHMPVTRDLSAGKRDTLLKYLDAILARETQVGGLAAPTTPRTSPEPPAGPVDQPAGKTPAARAFARVTGRANMT
jgi:hypothetical protein